MRLGRPRIAVIGAGRWGRQIISCLRRMPDARLVAVASSNEATRSLVPDGCEIVARWTHLLDRNAVDGAVISSPPRLHSEMALASLDAGLGVLIEKPMCLTTAEARDIVTAARQSNSVVQVNHIDLRNTAWTGLIENLHAIGPITSIEGVIGGRANPGNDVIPHWDYGPHFLACCLTLMGGGPDAVACRRADASQARSTIDAGDWDGEGAVEIRLRFGNVAARILTSGSLTHRVRRLAVHGTTGTLVYDDCATDRLVFQSGAGDVSTIRVAQTTPLENALRRFTCALNEPDRADIGDAVLGQQVVEILCQCDEQLLT